MSVPPETFKDEVEDHRALLAIFFTVGTFLVAMLGFFGGFFMPSVSSTTTSGSTEAMNYAKSILIALLPIDAIFLRDYFSNGAGK